MKLKNLVMGLTLLAVHNQLSADEAVRKQTHPLAVVTSETEKHMTYAELIEQYKLPGVSLAVIDNYKLIYSTSAGVKEFGKPDKIDRHTAFSTASIAKPVTALLTAMLAEQGKLRLDDPIQGYLKRWKIPPSKYAGQVTFRQLLSHTGGTSQTGFADFYRGDDIPTAIDSLNGKKLPRYDKPIEFLYTPGTNWRYSGGGYVIVQIALEDITGKPLAALAESMLFSPLGMSDSTMYQDGESGFLSNVAKVHDAEGQVIGTGIPICPQVAPSGLWSTPEDLAKLIIGMQRALAGKSETVISPWVAQTTTQVQTIKHTGGWGLGWMRADAYGNLKWFSHAGSNTGVGGHAMGTMDQGRGVVVLANGDRPARQPVIDAIIENVMKKQGWNQPLDGQDTKLPPELISDMTGRYQTSFGDVFEVTEENGQLYYKGRFIAWSQPSSGLLYHLGKGKFSTDDLGLSLQFQQDGKSKKSGLVFSRSDTPLTEFAMEKLP